MLISPLHGLQSSCQVHSTTYLGKEFYTLTSSFIPPCIFVYVFHSLQWVMPPSWQHHIKMKDTHTIMCKKIFFRSNTLPWGSDIVGISNTTAFQPFARYDHYKTFSYVSFLLFFSEVLGSNLKHVSINRCASRHWTSSTAIKKHLKRYIQLVQSCFY